MEICWRSATALRATDQSFAHWFFYRYADVLLMKAEALNETGAGAEALNIIYNVRKRANALDATDLSPTPADKTLIQDFILQERSREFCFEGKRWYDILRFAKRSNYARLPSFVEMQFQQVFHQTCSNLRRQKCWIRTAIISRSI